MITEDYVSFETAKLLKEKGFDETCRAFLKEWNGEISLCGCNSSHIFEYCHNTMLENYNDNKETNIAAPTLQMAMKWLRENHIVIIPEVETFYADGSVSSWEYHIWYDDNYEEGQNSFSSYEEAAEAAIKYCLENLS